MKDLLQRWIAGGLLWKASMGALALVCAIMLGLLWLSGSSDTREAFADGRRLLIKLENGAIDGKQITLDTAESSGEKPAEGKAGEPAAAGAAGPEATGPAQQPAARPDASEPQNAAATGVSASPAEASTRPAEAAASVLAQMDAAIRPGSQPIAQIRDDLVEHNDAGNLPAVSPKGVKPWSYYAKRYLHKGNLPTIAILVTGLGHNRAVTESAIRLPENISLSFSPYGKDTAGWMSSARVAGHETFLDLPLEPGNFPATDPGPYGLLAGKGYDENARRLKWLMTRGEGYVGFVTPANESFSNDDAAFKDLLEQINNRGLMICMPHEPARNDTKKILDSSKAPYSIADLMIDEEPTAGAIQARLQLLQKTASKRGFAVGIAQAYPLTTRQLAEWSATLEKSGYTLVPLTFITKIRFSGS